MSELILLLSTIIFIKDLTGIKKLRFSFIIRYIFVGILFKDLEVFSNQILNFFVVEAISIGTIIYILSYSISGIIFLLTNIKDTMIRKTIYFIVYIVLAIILWVISLILNENGYLPIL